MWTDERGSELLPLAECVRLLANAAKKGLTGRLGISTEHAPIIQPVNFGYHDHRILVRLGFGHMADMISGALVAFEVDDVDRHAQQAWSVLVRGLATPVEESERRATAKFAPTPLVPAPGDTVFVVRLDVVTGRRFALERAKPESARRGAPAVRKAPRRQ
jgi:nitroimidazol reductase NimA-like FMN-containing flavoprotein (pyridoxamine 5'-phosphate oxidase superfamily)